MKQKTDEFFEVKSEPPRANCPVCGARAVVIMRGVKRFLDQHHDKRVGYVRWCDGSGLEVTEAKR